MSEWSDYVAALSPNCWWRLGDASGAPQDSSGNGYHAAAQANLTYGQTGAIAEDSDDAIAFNGTNAYATIPSAALNPDHNDDFTIIFWVKSTNDNSNDRLIYKFGVGDPNIPFFIADNGDDRLSFGRYDGTHLPTAYGPSGYNDGDWHFVVCRKDGSTLVVKMDDVAGSEVTDTCTSFTPNSSVTQVGRTANGAYYWAGTLDEIAFWNSALADGQLRELYLLGVWGALWTPRQGRRTVSPVVLQRPRIYK